MKQWVIKKFNASFIVSPLQFSLPRSLIYAFITLPLRSFDLRSYHIFIWPTFLFYIICFFYISGTHTHCNIFIAFITLLLYSDFCLFSPGCWNCHVWLSALNFVWTFILIAYNFHNFTLSYIPEWSLSLSLSNYYFYLIVLFCTLACKPYRALFLIDLITFTTLLQNLNRSVYLLLLFLSRLLFHRFFHLSHYTMILNSFVLITLQWPSLLLLLLSPIDCT